MNLRHWAVLGGLSFALVVISGQPIARSNVLPHSSASAPVRAQTPALRVPANLRIAQSLADCRTYAGGGLAGIGCAAAMDNRWYILIWDWRGGAVDGFRVYQSRVFRVGSRTVTSWALSQTISQQSQVRVALLDPRQVVTSGCFTVTAYSVTIESAKSTQTCVNAASAGNPVFESVALAPSTISPFYGYHHERTHLHYCSNGSWPNYPDGTGVWRAFYPVPVDWGMVMYEADWHAGTMPFKCPEFVTQVLRLGLIFTLPSHIATLQSATLVGAVQEANTNCSYALYTLATETTPTNPAQLSTGQPPPDNSITTAIPGSKAWQANMWLYPESLPAIAGFWTWPPGKVIQLNADVTALVRQGISSFLLEPQDSIALTTGDAFGSPAGSSFVHRNITLCQTQIRNIHLNLKYTSTAGS